MCNFPLRTKVSRKEKDFLASMEADAALQAS